MVELYANRRLRLNLCKFISNSIFSQILLTILILDISLRLSSAIISKRLLCDSRERDQKTQKKKFKKAHYCVEISDARASREAEWPIATRPRFIGPHASIMQAGEHPKEPDKAPVLWGQQSTLLAASSVSWGRGLVGRSAREICPVEPTWISELQRAWTSQWHACGILEHTDKKKRQKKE